METGIARAVRIGLKEGAEYARKNHTHHRQTGRLTSPKVLRGELRSANASGAWGYLTNYTPYGAYIEYGTKAHDIRPKRAKALRFMVGHHAIVGGEIVFAKRVRHPGTDPMPFMGPASEYAGTVIVREIEDYTFSMIAKLWD
jgi:hypothetical protein